MSAHNQFIVTGNVGADPELHKKSEASAGVVSFKLAENVSRLNEKSKKYEHAHTNWFPVKAFGNLGARVKAGVKKGDRVTVFGKLRTYQYENDEGAKVSAFEILADDICISEILSKAPGAEANPEDSSDFNDFRNL